MEPKSRIYFKEDPHTLFDTDDTFDNHLFSFVLGEGDSFPEDYLDHKEEAQIYDEVYSLLISYLEKKTERLFSYQGVNLFWCFKGDLFRFVYQSFLKYRLFKKIIERHPEKLLFLEKKINFEYPYLFQIIHSIPRDFSHIQWGRGAPIKQLEPGKQENRFAFSLRRGNIRKASHVIFSDYEKSKNVIRHLDSKKVVYYTTVFSPRIFLKSFLLNFFYFGASLRDKDYYVSLSRDYLSKLESASYFKGLFCHEIDLQKLLIPKVQHLFRQRLPKLLCEIDDMRLFFRKAERLKSALLDEDIDASKNAFCQIAKQYQVRTFVECHGALGHKIGFLPLTADYLFAWGEASRKKLISWGCADNRILVSGCSRYDHYKKIDAMTARKQISRDFHLTPRKKIVLIAFMPLNLRRNFFGRRLEKLICETLSVMNDFPEVQFMIKIHPGDPNKKNILTWVKKYLLTNNVVMIERYDSLMLTKASDMVVVYNSTFAVDALALGKPVISLYDSTTTIVSEYRDYRVFYYSENREELKNHMRNLLKNGGQDTIPQTAYQELLYENGGEASKIIASYLSNSRGSAV